MKNVLLMSLMVLGLMTTSCKKDAKNDKMEANAPATSEAVSSSKVSGKFNVNASSTVLWEGSKPAGTHSGYIKVSEGSVAVENGKVTAGQFTLDMSSLTVTDLKAGEGKEKLEGHLKSEDFFNVTANPSARFEITKTTGLANDATANHLIYGDLTINGVTKPVNFKANVEVKENMVNVSTDQFNIDRTNWGVKYGSGTFFDDLKDKVISDDVGIKIALNASK